MKNFEIIFYNKENGDEPAKDFLLSLDEKMQAKMLRTISFLAINGFELREPYSHGGNALASQHLRIPLL